MIVCVCVSIIILIKSYLYNLIYINNEFINKHTFIFDYSSNFITKSTKNQLFISENKLRININVKFTTIFIFV